MISGIIQLIVLALMYFGLSFVIGQAPTMEGMILMVGGALLIHCFEIKDKIDGDVDDETFEDAWARMEAEGFIYGDDELEQVRLGWELARGSY